MIVHGANDGIVPIECAQYLHHQLSDSELVVIDKASHLVMVEHPELCADHIFPLLMSLL